MSAEYRPEAHEPLSKFSFLIIWLGKYPAVIAPPWYYKYLINIAPEEKEYPSV